MPLFKKNSDHISPCHSWFDWIINVPVTSRTKQIPSTKPYFLWRNKRRLLQNGSQACVAWNDMSFCADTYTHTYTLTTNSSVTHKNGQFHRALSIPPMASWQNMFNPVKYYEKYDRDMNLQQHPSLYFQWLFIYYLVSHICLRPDSSLQAEF